MSDCHGTGILARIREAEIEAELAPHLATHINSTARPRPRRKALHARVRAMAVLRAQHAVLVARAVPVELVAVGEEVALRCAFAVGAL